MSRLAEALNKVGEGLVLPKGQGSAADRVHPPDATLPQLPWDLAESRRPALLPLGPVEGPSESLTAAGSDTRPLLQSCSVPLQEVSQLVDRLFPLGARDTGRRTVLFAPVGSAVRSAVLCACAGDVLASRSVRRVCVVECGMQAPALHEPFGLTNSTGLSEALLANAPWTGGSQPVGGNLWLLSAGLRGSDAVQYLTPERIQPRLRELRCAFDYVLVHTAPVEHARDAFVLGPLVDGVVLVLKADSTRRATAKRIAEQLHASGVTVLGAVLTDRSLPIPQAIYRHL